MFSFSHKISDSHAFIIACFWYNFCVRVETLQNTIPKIILTEAGKFAFPLYNHKRESDKANKHAEWTIQKHIALTTLAILTDLGFDVATAILFFSGNRWESVGFKALHNAGAEILPQTITDLRNRMR